MSDYGYQPTEEDWNDYRDFLISREKEQIAELREYHRNLMPERFFNLVVWDYEFPERKEEDSIVEVTNLQMEIPFFETLEIHF